MSETFIDSLSFANLSQFHFLRPWWALAVIPVLVVLLIQFKRADVVKRWQTIIAPHLLQHLLLERRGNRLLKPASILCLLMLLLVLLLMGPTWSRQPSPFLKDAAALVTFIT